jgi:hypothetical protein
MCNYFGVFVALLCITPCSAEQPATVPSTLPSDRQARWYAPKARIAYDLCRFPLTGIAATPKNFWVLAEIVPDGCGTTVEDPRWEMNEDGLPITPRAPVGRPDAGYVTRGGAVNVRVVLGNAPPCAMRYDEVIRPIANEMLSGGAAREIYDVFLGRGGCVVCQVNDGYPGRSRYAPALLIPNDWAADIEPAIRFVREHPDNYSLNEPPKRDVAMKSLRDLCGSENPFLAIAAFKLLSDNEAIGIDESCKMIAFASSTEKQAALALILLWRRPPAAFWIDRTKKEELTPRIDERTKALTAVATSAHDFNRVRGIAVACFARYHAPPRHDNDWVAGHPLVQAIIDTANRSRSLSAQDRQLSVALEGWMNPAHPWQGREGR